MSVNRVFLIGRLGQDVELKYTPSGTAVANFSLATSERFKKDNEMQERTEWSRIVAFGKTAELCNQYLKKGSQAYIDGKIQTRSWEDDTGAKRYSTEIIANSVQFLDSKSDNTNESNPNKLGEKEQQIMIDTSQQFAQDEIPF